MAQGKIEVIKDWGPHKGGPKHKHSVKLEGSQHWLNTTNGAFAQQFQVGDTCTIEANEFPENSGKYWFNRFGSAAPPSQGNPAQHAPQREDFPPMPPPGEFEALREPTGDTISTSKSIFAQSVLKSWVDPNCSNDEMEQRVRAVVELVKGLPV